MLGDRRSGPVHTRTGRCVVSFFAAPDTGGEPTVWHGTLDNPLLPAVPVVRRADLLDPGFWPELVRQLAHDPQHAAVQMLTMDTEYHIVSGELRDLQTQHADLVEQHNTVCTENDQLRAALADKILTVARVSAERDQALYERDTARAAVGT